ncbi:MAG: hypothetical protein NVS3B10_09660 [Polyangiales bacterium]
MRAAIALLCAVIAGPAVAGCGSKEDVALSAYTQNPRLAKAANPFGFKLDGGVEVVLDLGAYSKGSVQVDGVTIRLCRGDACGVLPRAKISTTDGTSFPVTVDAGAKKTVHYAIAIDQLTPDEVTELCAAPISISGTVEQHGSNTPMRLGATPIAASGCP